jgi:hypothetical protein
VFYKLVDEQTERFAIEANRSRPSDPGSVPDLEIAG